MHLKATVLLSLLATAPVLMGQVGIGTTTPHASAQLDVTSSSKGLLPPRVALTGTADTTTVSSPASGLVVYNTATAGSGGSAVKPGLYSFNGTSWALLNNEAPVATVLPVLGTLAAGTGYVGTPQGLTFRTACVHDVGMQISLPPGKWAVKVGINAAGKASGPWPALGTWRNRFFFRDNQTTVPGGGYDNYNEDGVLPADGGRTADTSIPGTTQTIEKLNGTSGSISMPVFVEGTIYLNNTGVTAKTYYLSHSEVFDAVVRDSEANVVDSAYTPVYDGLGGQDHGMNYLVAYPFDHQ